MDNQSSFCVSQSYQKEKWGNPTMVSHVDKVLRPLVETQDLSPYSGLVGWEREASSRAV